MPEASPVIPAPVMAVTARLEDAGHGAWLLGRCLRELETGEPTSDFELSTTAPPEVLMGLFPRAVVTGPEARRLTLPTTAGPVDIVPLGDRAIEDALRGRDFRLHAVAYRPGRAAWVDPFEGRRDRAEGRLRTPGPARASFAVDPLRAVRAARLVAQLNLRVEPDVEAAMRETAPAFEKRGGRRLRVELDALLLGPHAEDALRLLARTGIAALIAPGASTDAPEVVSRLPRDPALRWAGWLRGARLRSTLRDLRCPRDRAARIEQILQLHPVDSGTRAAREARARRLARRPEAYRGALLALREAELDVHPDPAGRSRLDHLRACLERALRTAEQSRVRSSLALDGLAVMGHLGCRPGATVGRALRFLAEQVQADPALNEPGALRRLLDDWAVREGLR